MTRQQDAAKIRAALAKLESATTPAEKKAAKAEANTVGAQVALTIPDRQQRQQFAAGLESSIDDAYGGSPA